MTSLSSSDMAFQDKNQVKVVLDDLERSDPTVNLDPLPDNHPIHLEAFARKLYENGRTPPFTLNKRSEMEKLVVIPTRNGSRPKDEKAVKVKIVAKVCTLLSAFICSMRCPRAIPSFRIPSRCPRNIHDSIRSLENSILTLEFTTSYGTKTICFGLLT